MADETPDTRCAICDAATANRCSSCAAHGFDLFFCSKEHQKLVWKTHRDVCGAKSNPFMPPHLPHEEHTTLQKAKPHFDEALCLNDKEPRSAARAAWNEMFVAGAKPVMFTALFAITVTPTAFSDPRVKQAVLLQAYAHLDRIDHSTDRPVSPTLTPFHRTASMYTAICRLHPGIPATPHRNVLLHVFLILFTLLRLETRPEGPPAAYKAPFLVNAIKSVINVLSMSGICAHTMGKTFKLLEDAVGGIVRIEVHPSHGEDAPLLASGVSLRWPEDMWMSEFAVVIHVQLVSLGLVGLWPEAL
ncbi:hypothetical protein JCM10450v2_005299 [Rhodotorula kratochvilovae]